jgi:hypothetical protein
MVQAELHSCLVWSVLVVQLRATQVWAQRIDLSGRKRRWRGQLRLGHVHVQGHPNGVHCGSWH